MAALFVPNASNCTHKLLPFILALTFVASHETTLKDNDIGNGTYADVFKAISWSGGVYIGITTK